MSRVTVAEHQALKSWAYQVTGGASQMENDMSHHNDASEAYAWLADNPVGAWVVVANAVADHIFLTQGGLLYRGNLWHAIKFEPTSPGTGCIFLQVTPYKDRRGSGPRVALSNPDQSTNAGIKAARKVWGNPDHSGPLDSVGQ